MPKGIYKRTKPSWKKGLKLADLYPHVGFQKGNQLWTLHDFNDSYRKKLSDAAKKRGLGKISYRIGLKHSEESKRKMRESALRLGLRPPCGVLSPFYKGGISPENEKARKTAQYRLWREAVFARDNWACRECKTRGGKLHAHHIKSFSSFPELRYAIDNGITLCARCHRKTDNYGINKKYVMTNAK